MFTLFQTNVLVDSEGVPRIAGLGSASLQSSPLVWSEDLHGFSPYSAPELGDPQAFDLPNARTTKASDIYAFGVLACQVKHVSTPILNNLFKTLVVGFCRHSSLSRAPQRRSDLRDARRITPTPAKQSRALRSSLGHDQWLLGSYTIPQNLDRRCGFCPGDRIASDSLDSPTYAFLSPPTSRTLRV